MTRRGAVDPVWGLVGLAAAFAFAVSGIWDPNQPGVRLCVFRNLLELSCPGCGLTRAMSHLAHGSLARAFELHPLAPLLALEAGGGWVVWGLRGREASVRWVSRHAEALVLLHAAPFLALWLGRAATGTLPY